MPNMTTINNGFTHLVVSHPVNADGTNRENAAITNTIIAIHFPTKLLIFFKISMVLPSKNYE
jgi:hypothetical protein